MAQHNVMNAISTLTAGIVKFMIFPWWTGRLVVVDEICNFGFDNRIN
jgi:hypothetical protein